MFKCSVCGHDGFWVVRVVNLVNGGLFEVWECLECLMSKESSEMKEKLREKLEEKYGRDFVLKYLGD